MHTECVQNQSITKHNNTMKNVVNRALAAKKKQIILFIAVLMSIGAMAQGHLKFKGVEMAGTPREFAQKLAQTGLTYLGVDDGIIMLQGDFAGVKKCQFFISDESEVVDMIGVYTPDYDDWSSLYSQWSRWKDMLTRKYGEPTSLEAAWTIGHEPTTDTEKLYWFEHGGGKFEAIFTIKDLGVIKCEMRHSSTYNYVSLLYEDYQGMTIVSSDAYEDL